MTIRARRSMTSSWVELESDLRVRWNGTRTDRHQHQSEVAHVVEKSVQGRLVGDLAAEQGRSVGLVGDGHAVETARPSGAEEPLEPNLVRASVGGHPAPALSPAGKLGADLVSRHHHMW